MRVLVTGASGFIGRHLVDHLMSQGHAVRALSRPGGGWRPPPGVEQVHGDVTVPASLRPALAGVDAVVHLAARQHASRPGVLRRVNVEGTQALAAEARAAGVSRLIFMSSLAAQGPSSPDRPHRVAGQEAPIDELGRSKLEAEAILRAGEGPTWTTVIRPGLVIGPGDRLTEALSALVRSRVVPTPSDLQVSLLPVLDLVRLIDAVLRAPEPPFGPFFAATPAPHRVDALLDMIERQAGSGPTIRLPIPAFALRALAPVVEAGVRATGLLPSLFALRGLGEAAWTCDPSETTAAFNWKASESIEASVRPRDTLGAPT